MSKVRMILEKPDQSAWVWTGEAKPEEGCVVLRHGRLGGKMREQVVSAGDFSQDNAELELQHRVSKKWAQGYVEDTPSPGESISPPPAAESKLSWPVIHLMPTAAFREACNSSAPSQVVERERSLAEVIVRTFETAPPADWGAQPKMLMPDRLGLPFLIYACALARHGLVNLADDAGESLEPRAFIERHQLEQGDPRISAVLPQLGLVSVGRALDLAVGEDTGEWFF